MKTGRGGIIRRWSLTDRGRRTKEESDTKYRTWTSKIVKSNGKKDSTSLRETGRFELRSRIKGEKGKRLSKSILAIFDTKNFEKCLRYSPRTLIPGYESSFETGLWIGLMRETPISSLNTFLILLDISKFIHIKCHAEGFTRTRSGQRPRQARHMRMLTRIRVYMSMKSYCLVKIIRNTGLII